MGAIVNSLQAERLLRLLGQGPNASSEVRRHMQFLFRVLDSLHAGIIVIDRTSRIIYANQAYARIIGVPVDKVIGKRLANIEPKALLLKSLEEGRPLLDGYVALESVDRRLVCDHTPIVDDAGNVVGAVATFRDANDLGSEAPYGSSVGHHALLTELPVPFTRLVGKNWRLLETLAQAHRAARSDCTIIIRGESGTGKELLAKAIHAESNRANGPMVIVNCAAIPENLLESELFGYEDGAFTGARRTGKPGKVELADGGTLFLDEIGEMSPLMQAKLLRVLQERHLERVGGVKPISVNIRALSATHRNLEDMVAKGLFREDLYYRLNVVPLLLPPLRDRLDDIPCLVDHFLRELTPAGSVPLEAPPAYIKQLMAYPWPGNIRELRNVLEYSLVMALGATLQPEHLPKHLMRADGKAVKDRPSRSWDEIRAKVQAMEREALTEALTVARGNRSKAIKALGIGRATFYKKLEEFGMSAR